MKVSFYELLGMIKENKQPKKIKWGCHDLEWFVYGYKAMEEFGKPSLNTLVGDFTKEILNEEVEIIEDNNKIEKIEIDNMDRIKAPSTGNFVYSVSQPMKIMIKKINEIIDKLEKMDK